MEMILSPDKTDRLSLPVFEAAGVEYQIHGDQNAVALASADGRYRLLVVADSPF
jgi:hypothetical protein